MVIVWLVYAVFVLLILLTTVPIVSSWHSRSEPSNWRRRLTWVTTGGLVGAAVAGGVSACLAMALLRREGVHGSTVPLMFVLAPVVWTVGALLGEIVALMVRHRRSRSQRKRSSPGHDWGSAGERSGDSR